MPVTHYSNASFLYHVIDLDKGYLLIYWDFHILGYWVPYVEYGEPVDMPCFWHGEADILKLFKNIAIQSQKVSLWLIQSTRSLVR